MRLVLVRVHRWLGLLLGLHASLVGLTGAALVFQPQIQRWEFPQFDVPREGPARVEPGRLFQVVEQAYPGHRVTSVNWPSPQRNSFVSYPSRDGRTRTVFLHPYTGAVLGELPESGISYWLREAHVYLLGGPTGFRVNGYAAGGLVVLVLAGLAVWWPRGGTWRRALRVDATHGWRRLLFDAHGVLGVGVLVLALMWGVTGLYLTFPAEFRAAVSRVSPLTVRRDPPVSDVRAAGTGAEPEAGELVQRATSAVPGARPARYTRAMRAADPVVVLVATDEVGDRLTSDEVSVYFDRYTGTQLATRAERGSTWGDWLLVWLFPVHAGWFGGWVSRLLWPVAALALPVLWLTGAALWGARALRRG